MALTASPTVIRAPDNVTVVNTVSIAEPITVDAVDLDIRNLVFATDKVDVSGSVLTATPQPATQGVTATSGTGTGVTLTIGAAGAGLFHHITRLQITASTSPVALAANAFAVVTSTNLPGSPSWDMLIQRSGGGKSVEDMPRVTALKSVVADTVTTVVAPAIVNTIWRLNVEYFIGT